MLIVAFLTVALKLWFIYFGICKTILAKCLWFYHKKHWWPIYVVLETYFIWYLVL